MWLVVFCSVLFAGALAEERESRLVQTAQGPVRGYKDLEDDVFAFLSIPYATAPTGTKRFTGPLPAPEWQGTLDAVDKGIVCPQAEFILEHFKQTNMQEDCLIANIYVPNTEEINLPVYVYVHGGGYLFGFGNLVTHKKLISSKNIILVNFNYRLGPHGFLCLGTEDAPGNAGMKDQVALLRWVKKNIANFGGNPEDVTIGGGSAGSSAVDLLMLSKMTDGLFNKVIPESGANTAAFSIQLDPIENAKEYGKFLNFENVDDIYTLENSYKSASYKDLVFNEIINRTDSVFLMSPCVESITKEEPFLLDSPVNILKSGNYKKLPMLYGFANMEGLFRAPLFDTWLDRMNEKFSDFLPADLQFENEKQKDEVANKVKKFYFSDDLIDKNSILSFIDYFTDVVFAYGTLRSVKLHVEAGNHEIYLYEYSYVDENMPLVPYTSIRGANHCAQSMAIGDDFNVPGIFETKTSEEYETVRANIRNIWANFITTGKPIPDDSDLPEWPSVGADWSPHMTFNKTMELKGSLLKNRSLFWNEIYNKHYRTPIPPSKTAKYKTEL